LIDILNHRRFEKEQSQDENERQGYAIIADIIQLAATYHAKIRKTESKSSHLKMIFSLQAEI
jgi:ectoine hydroxylase-related dioxygenase (phytanoyl-CoA dioxygenase family)